VTAVTLIYDLCSLLVFNQILSHASPLAKLSEQQIEKIKSSGLGKLIIWSPQQFILNHPVIIILFYFTLSSILIKIKIIPQATGWFVTHGGFNSITESLGSGIPL
jgi:hypothetical protein